MDRADAALQGTCRSTRIVDLVTSAGSDRPAHRPGRYADLTDLIDAREGGIDSVQARSEIASATAALVVQAGRGAEPDERFVGLADKVGLDTLAALWSHAEPVSLPGVLWALYLLRQWCWTSGEEVTRLWRAGEPLAKPDAVVAGVGEYASIESVRQMTDAVLNGAYAGDFAVALERAAALFRVVAAGRRDLAGAAGFGAAESDAELDLAAKNEKAATDLAAAAALWRKGALA
jgi:hypothetical protein